MENPQQQQPAPLQIELTEREAEVIRLLENGVSPDRVGALAKQYGIAFQVNEDAEKQLRGAGATSARQAPTGLERR